MKKNIKLVAIVIAFVLAAAALSGCNLNAEKINYFEEKYDNPLEDADLGGNDFLSLTSEDNKITLENENVRLIIDATSGGIMQLANKQAKLYLVDDVASLPFTLQFVNDEEDSCSYTDCKITLNSSSDDVKAIYLYWTVTSKITVSAAISLAEGSSRLRFDVEVTNDANRPLLNVQYPVIQNIDTLYEKERDYLAHPFATGYLFNNPVDNFNNGDCSGITRQYGLYPSGWECPMQFFAYYSQGIGGFMFSTEDGGNGIKSFSFAKDNQKLKAGIYHYADDLADEQIKFNYGTFIGNLTKGSWYEAADNYRDWAEKQSWTAQGTLQEREDINIDFYENTVLCNFNFPYETVYGTEQQTELYNKIKTAADGKMLNMFFVADNFLLQSQANGDFYTKFEFPDFHSAAAANLTPSEWLTLVLKHNGDGYYYNLDGDLQFFECPSCLEYWENFVAREEYLQLYNKVSGYYHDVGVAAPHPKQCFNSDHPHGTRVNIIGEYLKQMAYTKQLASVKTSGVYGQELVFEQMLPYVDFFQARANASLVGWMESNRIRSLVMNGSCRNVNMFDYVYSEYGVVRLDGYLNADELIGESYYHIAAYTALMGGIPEFNFEFVHDGVFLASDEHNGDMLSYIGYLGNIRQGYGKDYLVYGKMVKPPKATDESVVYDYIQQRTSSGIADGGEIVWDKVITSAYSYNGSIGVFLCNPTSDEQEINFIINALADYGIESGVVELVNENGSSVLCNIESGKAKVSLTIGSREVVLLVLEANK